MLKTYIKRVHHKLPVFNLLHLNLFSFILTALFFFVLPLVIRRYYIIGNECANVIKFVFLLLFEFSSITIAIAIKDLQKTKELKKVYLLGQIKGKVLNTIIYTFTKTLAFLAFIYVFRVAIKMSLHVAFVVTFFYFFFIFSTFWLAPIIANEESCFLKAVYKSAHLFILHPFFSFFVFLHVLFLSFLSIFLFNLFPGQSLIFFNIDVGYKMLAKDAPYSNE